ncbi:5'-3' exonuclease H3TH domain-containing protein [Paenibacillus sp. 453mf]|uniref:5'-3' exonuclease n=1 Tax=Paenibacillus sp. 453mf TaxID=1761874 RepID=UPI0008F32D9D|nr:5'-3' exonuclease H3TH domain-containing protein [Paenibacillus sp. 453mf]SFS88255.1 5'-3' exonuclease [Paenibacillus sp. 453mf]
MIVNIGVLFSPVGTVSSTFTSLASLAKQIPSSAGKVTNVELDNFRFKVQLSDDIDGDQQFSVTQIGELFELSLAGLSSSTLRAALNDLANKLRSEQIRQGAILDVKTLKLKDMKLSVELDKSPFQVKTYSQSVKKAQVMNEKSVISKDIMRSNNRLLLVDASNLISACYFATAYGKEEKDLMKSSTGVYTNAIKALVDRFISIVRIYAPTHVAIAVDEKRELLLRREIYPEYKANRDGKEKPQSLIDQIKLSYELFDAMNLPQVKVDRMEADDVIGHFAKRFIAEERGDVIVLSNDKDLFQLLDGNVTQVLSQNVEMTRDAFLAKYDGLTPEQFADFKALCGEDSDNIPGVPGVGEKTATKLLKDFGTVEEVLLNTDSLKGKLKEKLEQFAEAAHMSKQLAMLYTDSSALQDINFDELVMKINKEGMRSVLEELEINISKISAA